VNGMVRRNWEGTNTEEKTTWYNKQHSQHLKCKHLFPFRGLIVFKAAVNIYAQPLVLFVQLEEAVKKLDSCNEKEFAKNNHIWKSTSNFTKIAIFIYFDLNLLFIANLKYFSSDNTTVLIIKKRLFFI
jgi:hypothetical protein